MKILKFILGAGNENIDEIEKLSYIYSCAGFNMIDTACKIETVNMVNNGIKKANKEGDVKICVSLGLQDDIHLNKIIIDNKKCNLCKTCINYCNQNALKYSNNTILFNEKNCIGCMKCIQNCKFNAISTVNKYNLPDIMLKPLLNHNIDCIEYHCNSSDKNKILSTWDKIKSIYNGQLSICLNRTKLSDDEIINLLKIMVKDNNNIIIQADGNPMTGCNNDYKSNLQTIAFAQIIKNANINAKVILSGGTNAKTTEFAKMCDVNIDGVAIGSYARKIVKEFINQPDFWNNEEIQNSAIKIAKDLKEHLLLYL